MSGPALHDSVPFDGCIFIRPCANIANWLLLGAETVRVLSMHLGSRLGAEAVPYATVSRKGYAVNVGLKDVSGLPEDIAGLLPDHCNKGTISIKQVP